MIYRANDFLVGGHLYFWHQFLFSVVLPQGTSFVTPAHENTFFSQPNQALVSNQHSVEVGRVLG